ncbi:MAG: ribonuclease D [Alphaproteobacteria bacterium]
MTIITDSGELAKFCKILQEKEFITIDTEFLREKTYFARLCLIQISCPDKNAIAIDPLAENIDLSPLFDLLQNPDVLKVFHAGRQDLEIFYQLTGKVVTPIFDTQIAAMVCGFGESIGYEKLVNHVTGNSIDKSSQFTDWSLRPLSDKQITYALGDVTHLCDIYLYLKNDLEQRGRCDWVKQEKAILENPKTYSTDPYKAWERVKIRSPKPRTLAVLREVTAWRETLAQKRNVPKNWIMRDETLADMANQAPKDKKQLSKIRNLGKDIVDGKGGVQLLKAIEKGVSSPSDTWPKVAKKQQPPPHIIATIDVLKMLLKIQNCEHHVAAKIISSAADLEAIAYDDNADVPALQGWRREIFGQDALDLKHGKLAIGIKNGKITKFPVGDTQA